MADTYTAKARYYKTADGSKVVPEGDPEAATLYITPGREVPLEEAEALGLTKLDKDVPEPEPEAAAAPPPETPAPEAKAVEAPPENKGAARPTRP